MAPLKIGSLTLSHGLMLAPMAGVADTSFREICRGMGAEYTVSEMVSAKALCFEQRARASAVAKTAALCNITQQESPMAIQLFGREPQYMADAAVMIEGGAYRGAEQALPPAAIDINMGCPVPKVVGNGEGSALMKEPELAASIVRAVKDAVRLPVTVKIRAGFYNEDKNAPEFAKALEAAGADLICVHGRTRQQFYAPTSDNGIIAKVKKAVKVPVVGNGDLNCAGDVLRMLDETGCDGVMIARGALGNPFLFDEVLCALENREWTPPTVEKRLETALAHAADMVRRKGQRIGLAEARKHMVWYCKGLHGAAAARGAIMQADTLEGMKAIFDSLLAQNG